MSRKSDTRDTKPEEPWKKITGPGQRSIKQLTFTQRFDRRITRLTIHQTSLPESPVIKERGTLNVAPKIQFSSGVSINIFSRVGGKKTAVKMSKDLVQQSVAMGVHLKMSHAPHTYKRRNLFSAQPCRLLCSLQWPTTTPIIPTLNAPYNITSVKSMYILSQQWHLCPAGKSRAHHSWIFIIRRRKQWRPSPQAAVISHGYNFQHV